MSGPGFRRAGTVTPIPGLIPGMKGKPWPGKFPGRVQETAPLKVSAEPLLQEVPGKRYPE
jgi:hypothetical protein